MGIRFSKVVDATAQPVGTGCTIAQFRHDAFGGAAMSPFVMVDHFHMWQPTFDVHPHAGFSAVTLVFEDTKGSMLSRDSIGNNATFGAGDLHWTMAGRGILHTQLPAESAHVHALQIFVNLPASLKHLPPDSFHVGCDKMPVVETVEGARVRVVAGDFQGRTSPTRAPRPILMLDARLEKPNASIDVPLPGEWNAWVHVVQGGVVVDGGAKLLAGQAICASADGSGGIIGLRGSEGAHCVVLASERIDEPVIARGPFVFESEASLDEAVRDFRAGKFGSVASLSASKQA
jgi:redox-sensitive bicupin YhaK (pirin superfamily)